LQSILNYFDWSNLGDLIIRVVAVFLCIVIHEISHGFVANLLGDPTAKQSHRLSLNPLHHIDPIGLILMVVVGFGWAKPVPVNLNYFKNPKSGMALTSLAGPLSNFVLAFVAMWIAGLVINSGSLGTFAQYLLAFLIITAVRSIGLGIFNLIPIPPLDGSKVLFSVLPDRYYYQVLRFERYGFFLLFLLVATDFGGGWITNAIYGTLHIIGTAAGFPVSALGW
jgi:Zn-dependent protease